jgi:predicted membrane protein
MEYVDQFVQQFVLYGMCGVLVAIIWIGYGIMIKNIRESHQSKKVTLQKIQDELDELKKEIRK